MAPFSTYQDSPELTRSLQDVQDGLLCVAIRCLRRRSACAVAFVDAAGGARRGSWLVDHQEVVDLTGRRWHHVRSANSGNYTRLMIDIAIVIWLIYIIPVLDPVQLHLVKGFVGRIVELGEMVYNWAWDLETPISSWNPEFWMTLIIDYAAKANMSFNRKLHQNRVPCLFFMSAPVAEYDQKPRNHSTWCK